MAAVVLEAYLDASYIWLMTSVNMHSSGIFSSRSKFEPKSRRGHEMMMVVGVYTGGKFLDIELDETEKTGSRANCATKKCRPRAVCGPSVRSMIRA